MEKPRQGFAGMWNVSFGFFGIQIGFALQNANMSRIFQSLGEDIEKLPGLWVAAPLTGLLVQPIIGHMSDRTWLGRLGRRRPYFLAGALLATIALFLMPESPSIWFAAMMLWVLDASLNISMEPFRAFVGDMLRKDQHSIGYAVQTAFIGAGAVVGSSFPALMEAAGVANVAPPGQIPDTVRYAFWFGGLALFLAVLWTVVSTSEYTPAQMAAFEPANADDAPAGRALASRSHIGNFGWIAAGLAVILIQVEFALLREVLLLGTLLIGYGQFFSWSALFIMWINTTPIVAQYHFGTTDAASAVYQAAGNWVGELFAIYNGVAAIAALTLLPWLSRHLGQARTHMVGLACGAIGFASFFLLRNPTQLIFSEIFIGIFWASVLAMPYAILASSLPQAKLGIYMGLFNIFVVIPQLLVATVMGSIMQAFFPGKPIYTMAFAALALMMALAAMARVDTASITQ